MAHKILVVDDAMFMRTMIKNLLKSNSEFEVIGEAENGVEAIQKYKELQPDIVTLDITMPEMDGLEALKKLLKLMQVQKLLFVLQWDNKVWY